MGYLGRQMAVSDCGILDNGELITYKLQIMKHLLILLFTACTLLTYAQVPEGYPANYAKAPRFKALIYYTQHAEEAHVQFAEQATTFFKKLNYGDGFVLDITTDFSKYPYEKLKEYNVIIMLNTSPNTKAERDAFEQYMENGGGWVGFHAAAYNDKNTHWPWFVKFLVGVCSIATTGLPSRYWSKSTTKNIPLPRICLHIIRGSRQRMVPMDSQPPPEQGRRGTLVLSPKNYPLGIKDVVNFGDFPIVWSNKNYRMIYLNMGHGDEEFIDGTQNLLLVNAFRWVVSKDKSGNPFSNKTVSITAIKRINRDNSPISYVNTTFSCRNRYFSFQSICFGRFI